ncbi:major capsid protein [Niveibacterium terrae]|uniref:major capsid protein n=1 Tax=Niveibacterium terrae TaxID=3373598 RepID=UPI003A9322D8
MATLPTNTGRNTLLDVAKSFGPDGKVATVAELLNQSNEIISYMNFIEGNLPTGHKGVVRTGLPTVALRAFYKGVKVSKSGRSTIEDVCAMAEGRNEIDKDLADLNGNAQAFRLSESLAFVEAMNQTFAQQIIYGDTSVNPDGVLGLTPRYNSLSAQSGANVIDAGGTGSDNTSIWLVCWGENTVTGIYPKGSQAGLTQQDLGEIDAFDDNNDRFRAYGEIWKWKFGLHVKDWRYAVRIANVDVSDTVGQTGTQAITAATWINKLMIKAMARIPSMGMGTATFLASRTVKEMLAIGALDKSQNALSFTAAAQQYGTVAPGSVAGQGTGIQGGQLMFMGVPVLTVDQILATEARVV